MNEAKSFFAGFTVLFITIFSLSSSFIYNRATSTNATEVLKDAAVILFLNDLDEAFFVTIHHLCPNWIESITTVLNSRASVSAGTDFTRKVLIVV